MLARWNFNFFYFFTREDNIKKSVGKYAHGLQDLLKAGRLRSLNPGFQSSKLLKVIWVETSWWRGFTRSLKQSISGVREAGVGGTFCWGEQLFWGLAGLRFKASGRGGGLWETRFGVGSNVMSNSRHSQWRRAQSGKAPAAASTFPSLLPRPLLLPEWPASFWEW